MAIFVVNKLTENCEIQAWWRIGVSDVHYLCNVSFFTGFSCYWMLSAV